MILPARMKEKVMQVPATALTMMLSDMLSFVVMFSGLFRVRKE
jgi:hypothetical protein